MNSKIEFVRWLKENDPFVYLTAKKVYEDNQNNLSGFDFSGFFDSAIKTVQNIAPQVLKYRNQKKILDIQIDRARNNLPPINTTQYVPTYPPQQVQVQNPPVKIIKQVEQQARIVEKKSDNKLLIPLGIGALILALKG